MRRGRARLRIHRQFGHLNPPGGPVAPTGRTLSEIYNAVQAVGSGGPSTVEPVAEIREVIAVTVAGQSQGNIDGEDSIFGMQNVIKCFGIEHEFSVPFDGPTAATPRVRRCTARSG